MRLIIGSTVKIINAFSFSAGVETQQKYPDQTQILQLQGFLQQKLFDNCRTAVRQHHVCPLPDISRRKLHLLGPAQLENI